MNRLSRQWPPIRAGHRSAPQSAFAFSTCLLIVIGGHFPAAGAELEHFRIDADASEISVAVDEPMRSLRGAAVGRFRIESGDIYGDPANPGASGRVTLALDAASYRSSSSLRDRAVGSVLGVDRFPEITFASTAVEDVARDSDRGGHAAIVGNLTLHGVSRAMRVPTAASIDGTGRLIAEGEVSFRYDEFGIEPPTLLFGSMSAGNVATVKFHIVATRAQ